MSPSTLPNDEDMAMLDKAIADAEQVGLQGPTKPSMSNRQARKNNKRVLEDDNRGNDGPTDPMVQDEQVTIRKGDTAPSGLVPPVTTAPPNPPAATTPHFLPALEEGFPKIHGITNRDVFAMVACESKECWDSQDGPYILAYLTNNRDVQEVLERVARLQDLIKAALGSTSVIIGHTKPSNRQTSDINPLFPYYIGGLTKDQMDFLTERGCWSTPTITAFFILGHSTSAPASILGSVTRVPAGMKAILGSARILGGEEEKVLSQGQVSTKLHDCGTHLTLFHELNVMRTTRDGSASPIPRYRVKVVQIMRTVRSGTLASL
ncbi:hypothetical protein BD779DRAFT_1479290 [Infundibulicybe gibba]|nr:hypothetical protein BD779DRAFT_1479290 [Infundibulicybe gibba]